MNIGPSVVISIFGVVAHDQTLPFFRHFFVNDSSKTTYPPYLWSLPVTLIILDLRTMIEELERLGAMMEKGFLSAEEFTLAKAELLTPGRSRPAAKAELSPTVACTHINIYRAAIATVHTVLPSSCFPHLHSSPGTEHSRTYHY